MSSDIWNAVSAAAGIFAALIALITVLAALKSERDRAEQAVIDRRSEAFQKLVANPIDSAVDSYVEMVTTVLENAARELASMKARSESVAAINDYLSGVTHDVDQCWHKLKARLTRGIEAWGDVNLRNAARVELERLQDAVNEAVEDLFTEASIPKFSEILNRRVAEILKLAQRSDPAMADFYSPRVRSK